MLTPKKRMVNVKSISNIIQELTLYQRKMLVHVGCHDTGIDFIPKDILINSLLTWRPKKTTNNNNIPCRY